MNQESHALQPWECQLSPTIQVTILKHASAPFPLKNPGLVSIPLAFAVGIIVSLLTTERSAEAKFDEAEYQIHMGELMGTRQQPNL